MAAVRVPVPEGSKVTLIVQLALAATAAPQLLVWEKSPALVPEITMLATFKTALPVLDKVIV
jgi:hypothetical protein